MPLYNAGTEIVRAFLAGQEEGRQAKALKLKNEQETADRASREKIHQDSLKQANEHFNATMLLQKANAALTTSMHKQAIAKQFAETGIGPEGSTVTETPTTTTQQDSESLGRNTFSHFDPMTLQKVMGVVQGTHGPTVNRSVDLGGDLGSITVPDPLSYAQQQADRQEILQGPKNKQAEKITEMRNAAQMQLEQLKLDAIAAENIKKYKEKQSDNAERYDQQKALVRLRAGLRPAKSTSTQYLSPDDAMKLNVPYGTTKDEAARMSITPEKPRSPTEQAKLDGLIALRKELSDLTELGDATNWDQHAAYTGGLKGAIKGKLGLGTEAQTKYRVLQGKLNANYIHDTYGSVFSKNEQQLANTWLSSLSEAGSTAKAKLETGNKDLSTRIDQMLAPSVSTRRGSSPLGKGQVRKTITAKSGPHKGQTIPMISNDGGLTFEPEE